MPLTKHGWNKSEELDYLRDFWPVGKKFNYHGVEMIVEFSDHESERVKPVESVYRGCGVTLLKKNKSKIKASYKGENGNMLLIKLAIPILIFLENNNQ